MLLSGLLTLREAGSLTSKSSKGDLCLCNVYVCVCVYEVGERDCALCLLSAVIECGLKLSIFGDYLILAAGD